MVRLDREWGRSLGNLKRIRTNIVLIKKRAPNRRSLELLASSDLLCKLLKKPADGLDSPIEVGNMELLVGSMQIVIR